MARAALACAVLALATRAALGPVEPPGYGSASAWFCGFVREWKALMSRDYPDADRSVPEIERRCHLPREAQP